MLFLWIKQCHIKGNGNVTLRVITRNHVYKRTAQWIWLMRVLSLSFNCVAISIFNYTSVYIHIFTNNVHILILQALSDWLTNKVLIQTYSKTFPNINFLNCVFMPNLAVFIYNSSRELEIRVRFKPFLDIMLFQITNCLINIVAFIFMGFIATCVFYFCWKTLTKNFIICIKKLNVTSRIELKQQWNSMTNMYLLLTF